MLDNIIWYSIKNKFLVGLMVLAMAAYGLFAGFSLPVDAVPDITNNQVQVVTVSQGLAPQEVEQFITLPIELTLANIPGVTEIRSISRFGLSVITIVFDEKVPILDARQFVQEQLNLAIPNIPENFGTPELMPITTGLGEIYQYTLEVDSGFEHSYTLQDLRTIQDWIVKRQLSGIPGIVEVSSFGGFLKQYEVALNTNSLENLNITIPEIIDALENNNQNIGGSYIEQNQNAYYIRAEGLISSIKDIEQIVVKVENQVPILIKDIAQIKYGSAQRYGALTKNGKGETVGGITLMLKGANSSETIEKVKNRISKVQKTLPQGISLIPFLDRSELVSETISTVKTNLIEGGLIVIFILILFLGNWRSGLIVASVIPLSLLFALILMHWFGVSANLMSLGAIDFGIVIDGAVIVVESVMHTLYTLHLGKTLTQNELNKVVFSSSKKLIKSAFFGVIIILVVFIPVLTLQDIEGKMFKPMAQTVSFAILGALLLSVTYVPMMASLLLKKSIKPSFNFSDKLMSWLKSKYQLVLHFVLKFPKQIIVSAFICLTIAIWGFINLGSEFIPTLEEGDLAMQMAIKPGSSLSESIKTTTKVEKILLQNFPEVKQVVSKIGTAEIPTDPMAVEDADIMIILKEKDLWTSAQSRDELVDKMKLKLEDILGASFEFTQPIQLRFNELMTGAKADIAINIYGENHNELAQIANNASEIIKNVPGAGDVKVEQTEGFPQLIIQYNKQKLAQYGIQINQVNQIIKAAYAGHVTGNVFEGEKRFDLVIRLNNHNRNTISLSNLYVKTAQNKSIPLSEVAQVNFKEGAMQISRENTRRKITIGVNVRNRDVESLVNDIKIQLQNNLKLPPNYSITYGGEFENLIQAKSRLLIAVPIALALIFILLYIAFSSVKSALIIFSTVPLAAIGGVIALYVRQMPFSISAGIGFIALFGVAVLNGIVLIAYLNQLLINNKNNLHELIVKGSLVRLRPVLMTAAVASFGFLPMAISTSQGAEVQKPLATVVIGGLITATLLTLLVLPAIYYLVNAKRKFSVTGNKVISILIVLFCFSTSYTLKAQETGLYPSQLKEYINYGLQNHPLIKNAEIEIQKALVEKKSAINMPPTELVWQQGQINSALIDYNFQINQSIGKLTEHHSRLKLANQNAALMQSNKEFQAIQLETQIAQTYYHFWCAAESFKLTKQQIQLFANVATSINLSHQKGEISLLQKTYADLFINEIYQKSLSFKTDLAEHQAELINLAWLQIDTIPYPDEQMAPLLNFENKQSQLNTTLIKPLEENIMLKNQELKLQKAQYFPEITVGYFNQQLDGLQGFDGFQIGLAIPLWYKPTKAQVNKAKFNVTQMQNSLSLATNFYTQNLIAAQTKYLTELNKLKSMQEIINQLVDVKHAAVKSYQSGELSIWEFVTQMRQIMETELVYLNQLNQFNQAALQLNFLAN